MYTWVLRATPWCRRYHMIGAGIACSPVACNSRQTPSRRLASTGSYFGVIRLRHWCNIRPPTRYGDRYKVQIPIAESWPRIALRPTRERKRKTAIQIYPLCKFVEDGSHTDCCSWIHQQIGSSHYLKLIAKTRHRSRRYLSRPGKGC